MDEKELLLEKDKELGGLINSISRFILVASCQTSRTILVLKDLRNMVSILKFVKPVLDEVYDSQILLNNQLLDLLEELDMHVNKARETLENPPYKASRLCIVSHFGALVIKVQESALKLCCSLQDLLQSSPHTLLSTCVQQSIQEIQCADQGMTSVLIENARSDKSEPDKKLLMKIAESIGLASNHELLAEWISLEKEREKAELKNTKEESQFICQLIDLFNHIRVCFEKLDQFAVKNGIPIPSYFRCHLSLELMVDPVILASGQTFEHSFILKWLDNGLKVCPKTRQALVHTSLVPNDIVKALISNWCKENGISLCHSVESKNILFPSLCSSASEDMQTNCHDSFDKDTNSRHRPKIGNSPPSIASLACSDSEKEVLIVGHLKSTPSTPDCNCSVDQDTYNHGRTDSISSINSTTELLGKYGNRANSSECAAFSSTKNIALSRWPSSESAQYSYPGYAEGHEGHVLSVVSESDGSMSTHLQKLIEDLNCQSSDVQAAAALDLRLLAKDSRTNRVLIAKCGAIRPLISVLHSNSNKAQENAVTALLNLSINDNDNKMAMAEAGAIDSFIHVLKHGTTEAKENSAAALFSLSSMEEYRMRIGRSGAVRPLVDLLNSGSLRGKKDAAAALFNLSIFHENKARIVRAGAVKYLVELLDPEMDMVDKSVALLANLSTVSEGCLAISQEGGIPLLVEVVDSGSQRGKENAASCLLQLCIHSPKLGSMVLQEGAIPPLVALSQQGTPRAKEKAQQILGHFRSLRDRALGKLKS